MQLGCGLMCGGAGHAGEDEGSCTGRGAGAQVSCGWTVDGGVREQRERGEAPERSPKGLPGIYMLLPVFSSFCDQS